MKDFLNHVRYALRGFTRNPLFALVVVLTLALGIGIHTAVDTLVRGTLLRPLPFSDPERVQLVVSTLPKMGWNAGSVSIPEMGDVRERSKLLTDVAVLQSSRSVTMTGQGRPERMRVNFVTSSLFTLLRVRPELGRTFLPEEDQGANGHPVAILSHTFWKKRLGGRPGVIGSQIDLTGQPFTVVGVMPPDFYDLRENLETTDVWLPLTMGVPYFHEDMFRNRSGRFYMGAVRLKAGVSVPQAQGELDNIAKQLEKEFPYAHEGRGLRLISLHEWYYGDLDRPIKTLRVGAGFVLLICCVNIGTLLLVRGRARQGEMAVRAALGAGRRRLIVQLLAESLPLAILGGGLGVLLAWWATDAWVVFGRLGLPPFARVHVDLRVLGVSLLVILATWLVFGLAPSLQLSRSDLRGSLQARHTDDNGGRRMGRSLLMIVEVSLAVVLLVGAGLTAKSLARLIHTGLGFETRDLLTMQIEMRGRKYEDEAAQKQLAEQLVRSVQALAGVESATVWGPSMIGNATWNWRISPVGMGVDDPRGHIMVQRMQVTPGGLRALGIPILRGRDFTWADRGEQPYLVIADQRLAKSLWPGKDPLGQRFYLGRFTDRIGEVIGIAGDVLNRGRRQGPEQAIGDLYLCYLQRPSTTISLLVRFKSAPAGALAGVRRELAKLDPDLVLFDTATMRERLAREEASPSLTVILMEIYAFIATVLAAIGIYGVLAYTVQQRTPELAMRSAIGAEPRQLRAMVMRQGMAAVAVGLAIGLAAALALSRFIASLLYGVSRSDPIVYGFVVFLLVLVALAACYLPARRASSVDPMRALRGE